LYGRKRRYEICVLHSAGRLNEQAYRATYRLSTDNTSAVLARVISARLLDGKSMISSASGLQRPRDGRKALAGWTAGSMALDAMHQT